MQLIQKRTPKCFQPYRKEIQHFVNCINEETQPSPSGEDALEDFETITRAYKKQIRLN